VDNYHCSHSSPGFDPLAACSTNVQGQSILVCNSVQHLMGLGLSSMGNAGKCIQPEEGSDICDDNCTSL